MLRIFTTTAVIILTTVLFSQEPPPGEPSDMGGPPPDMNGASGPPPDMNGTGGPPPDMSGGNGGRASAGLSGSVDSWNTAQTSSGAAAVNVKSIQPADLAALKAKLKAAYPDEMAKIEPLFAVSNRTATAKMLELAAKMHAVPVSAPPPRDAVLKLRETMAKISELFPAEYRALGELRGSNPAAAQTEFLRLYRALPAKPPAATAADTTAGDGKQ